MSKANIHPAHLRKSGGKLKNVGESIQQTGEKLEQTGQNLAAHASGDRSGVGSVVAKFTGKATEITGAVFKEGGRVAGSAGHRLGATADLYEEADTTAARNLSKRHPDVKGKVDPHGGAKRTGTPVGKGKGGTAKKLKRVPGGGTHPTAKVGSGHGGKDRKAPVIPGGGGEPARLKGRLPDPDSAEVHLPELLERHGVTQEQFDSMRQRMNEPGGTANVTHAEAAKWRAIREEIPLDSGRPVQKVLSPSAAENYLNNVHVKGGFQADSAQGCFARVSDARTMVTPSDYREGLRLDYDDHTFPAGLDSVHVLRTHVDEPADYAVPFGGPTEAGRANIGGTKDWGAPFTGNGFTGSNDHLVPEWERTQSPLADGDQIFRIDRNGHEEPVATFDDGRWIPVGGVK
ncbi:WXG100 family type VII secretion target [Kutzneria sp. 744]|uniref:WXG100 family type VII secretion target n=1 Tax=Kutzneria sp. (strain 744) TaxID=345341 RepID=UPI0003EED74F|nr:hypothetical protein [Kutzneria sp. 744]EWM14646.1 translation initiation factor IF-2 [Kutzneria sp. 744]